MEKGLLLVKIIKVIRTVKYFPYYFFKPKTFLFNSPPNEIQEIGYLDKDRKVHVNKEFQQNFSKDSFPNTRFHIKLKPGNISLVWDGEEVLLKKHFSGLSRFFKFYNEIFCYDRMKEIDNIPKIKYVNFSSFDIFFEFNEGLCLLPLTRENKNLIRNKFAIDEIENIKSNITKTVNEVHSLDVFIYDLEMDNIIISYGQVYFIDFADSLYKGCIPNIIFEKFKKYDRNKLNEIMSIIDR